MGIDTGGTFTDLVIAETTSGRRMTVKVSSTPDRPSEAVVEALRRTGLAEKVDLFVLGTTVGTNALLQRRGERTLYLTTAGFEDALFIQRINRLGLYDLQWVKPAPYVRRADCLGVNERVASDGSVRRELEDAEVERIVDELRGREGAIAINLLFSFVNPAHERRLAGAIRAAFPDRSVSVSSEVAPVWREFERGNTVAVDASLKRLIADFATEVDAGLDELNLPGARFFMKSNGGQVSTTTAAQRPVDLTLSGLAGGLIAGRFYSNQLGLDSIVTLDMGGTSADVGLVLGGEIRSSSQYEFEWGLPIIVPVVDLSTVGAGGSSIAGLDTGGLLKVGPESAGARPGPACYDLGGTDPTITDANVVLGRLNPRFFLGGELTLDPELAHHAVSVLGARMGYQPEQAAQAILELAVENMAGTIRLLCADRGVDYRALDLMAFGGAGPLHAGLIAQRLGITRIVVPPHPGLVSAFGALVAELRVDRQITTAISTETSHEGELRAALSELAGIALRALTEEGSPRSPIVATSAGCRYVGQNYEQDVPIPHQTEGDLLRSTLDRFHEQHESRYGYRLPDAGMEIVRLSAVAVDADRLHTGAYAQFDGSEERLDDTRSVFFKDQGWVQTPVINRAMLPIGETVEGPLVIEEIDSTILVLDGRCATRHASGAVIVETSGRDGRPGAASLGEIGASVA